MAEYQVVFEGKLTGELPLDEVKRNLSVLFKMKAEQVDALFSGKPVVIKRDIDQATALKYQAAFKKAGAMCAVLSDAAENTGQRAKPQPASTPASASNASRSIGGTANPKDRGGRMAGKDIVNIAIPQDLSGLSMAEAGAVLEKLPGKQNAKIPDTSGLSFSKDDSTFLAPARKAAEVKVDTSGLTLEKSE
ncbi:MAG TPA: hypothetical protein VFX02_07950 [Gammaproteobacteria bacterium]|nr:hypothetical protein [Gammaproteobacteria bacterium]